MKHPECKTKPLDRAGVRPDASSKPDLPVDPATAPKERSSTSEAPVVPVHGRRDLLVLGSLGLTLSADDLTGSLGSVAELLRRAFAADDCELFLREPGQDDLLLAACSGPDRELLLACQRFPPGMGFPGIAVAEGRPVLTRELAHDPRFLRPALAKHGVRSFVSVPLPAPGGSLGSVDLAWRSQQVEVERTLDPLAACAKSIATTVRAGLAALRDRVDRAVDAEPRGADASRCRALLELLVREAGASAGLLACCASTGDEESAILATGGAPGIAPSALQFCRHGCPVLQGGHGESLGPQRGAWPSMCTRLPAAMISPCCLPLRAAGRLFGAVVLDYGASCPTPRTRDLVPLLAMAQQGATRIDPGDTRGSPGAAVARPALELRCLGAFELRVKGRVVAPAAFARKQALTLLKLLVLHCGNAVRRDVLVEILWPGVGLDAGTNRLHGVVHALRAVIEPFHREHRWVYVRNEGDCYRFDVESPQWNDLQAFRRHSASAARAEDEGRMEQAIEHMEQALSLYGGDLFMDDPEADWCAFERTLLQDRYLEMVARVAEHRIASGEIEQGIERLRRGVAVDPCREDLQQALIQALADSGRRHEALDQYRECVRVLREEIGVEPLAATRRLERLLGGPRPAT